MNDDDDLIPKARQGLADTWDHDPRDPLFGLSRDEMRGTKLSRRGGWCPATRLPPCWPTPAARRRAWR
ncbi:hypothetical protein [Maliponia aquimaris]|uniref:Uncharacterized protein n=1 Tax=Maliponia aquimaris TaxID=1673631 RepID=A0A238KK91_9RHOB|nr:hypothetical protein [Maliponia aquimaris]SMX43124.1 hypothetical protein MAA8898_02746 [Maliponia aquimaris]